MVQSSIELLLPCQLVLILLVEQVKLSLIVLLEFLKLLVLVLNLLLLRLD